jgi:predicted O-methyltransferase YrrM
VAEAPQPAAGRNPNPSDVEAAWGSSNARSLFDVTDLWKAAARLPLALSLARAAVRDPSAFRITAIAIRRHRALQKPLELFDYLRFLRRREITHCMEIGTLWGGTFFAHCAVAAPRGHMIAVDALAGENASVMTSRFRTLAREGQDVTCVWRDSHSESAAAQVAAALNGASLDVLFLDGDHSPQGVTRDYEMYSPLVRPGGVIAFHDIEGAVTSGVPAFWRAVRQRHESVEFVDRVHAPYGLGIGVIVKQ